MSQTDSHAGLVDGGPTGEEYRTRERVHDTDDPDGILVVLETLECRADAFDLTDGVTVADVYGTYPATDRVVTCIYQRDLDRLFEGWRDEAPRTLRAFYDLEYDKRPPGVHAYPSSKVERYTAGNYTVSRGRVVCENCHEWVETAVAWVEHFALECPGGQNE